MDMLDITELKAAIDGMIEMAPHNAKAVKAYYNALVEEGFTEDDALHLVTAHGYMPPLPRQGAE